MKSLSITRIITFIAFFSISALPASASFGFIDKLTRMFTSVDTIEQYDHIYDEYTSKEYEGLSHFNKLSQAKQFVYSHDYQNIASKFDTILHRHILVILCGRFVNLLRGEYNKEISWITLPSVINTLRYEHNWSEKNFIWTYNMSMNSTDPMFYYAKKFLNTSSGNGINPEVQVVDLVTSMKVDNGRGIKKTARFCKDLQTIYNIMKP
ncbi:hypothetical protein [Bartonella rattimassiliensis]|uniref:Uncharacterized protein n=1 Tax=Bartonella rattimassiliensis 15908 TaxID=1094556 RepID=J0QSJ8_9HYPH|nr:hypothetical protein [Bartonella rattimassiliensis]EJF86049.1 hypothetical protein MCY_00886 [Bartonella rattimassiliensis 15908]